MLFSITNLTTLYIKRITNSLTQKTTQTLKLVVYLTSIIVFKKLFKNLSRKMQAIKTRQLKKETLNNKYKSSVN